MATAVAKSHLTPQWIFDIINAHQQTEAMKAALELEIFTAIAEGNATSRGHRSALQVCRTRRAHLVRLPDHP